MNGVYNMADNVFLSPSALEKQTDASNRDDQSRSVQENPVEGRLAVSSKSRFSFNRFVLMLSLMMLPMFGMLGLIFLMFLCIARLIYKRRHYGSSEIAAEQVSMTRSSHSVVRAVVLEFGCAMLTTAVLFVPVRLVYWLANR